MQNHSNKLLQNQNQWSRELEQTKVKLKIWFFLDVINFIK